MQKFPVGLLLVYDLHPHALVVALFNSLLHGVHLLFVQLVEFDVALEFIFLR